MDQRWGARVTIKLTFPFLVCLCALGLVAVLVWDRPAHAQSEPPPPDQACKLCHVDTEAEYTLPSGEPLTLTVDLPALGASVHGVDAAQPVYCTDCHQDRRRYRYPHEPNPAQTRRRIPG